MSSSRSCCLGKGRDCGSHGNSSKPFCFWDERFGGESERTRKTSFVLLLLLRPRLHSKGRAWLWRRRKVRDCFAPAGRTSLEQAPRRPSNAQPHNSIGARNFLYGGAICVLKKEIWPANSRVTDRAGVQTPSSTQPKSAEAQGKGDVWPQEEEEGEGAPGSRGGEAVDGHVRAPRRAAGPRRPQHRRHKGGAHPQRRGRRHVHQDLHGAAQQHRHPRAPRARRQPARRRRDRAHTRRLPADRLGRRCAAHAFALQVCWFVAHAHKEKKQEEKQNGTSSLLAVVACCG